MMRGLWRRVRNMPREELSWRLQVAARARVERFSLAVRPSAWQRSDITRVLSDAVLDADLRGEAARGDWMAVQRRLEPRLAARRSRFILDHHQVVTLRREIAARWPSAPREAAAQAERAMTHRHDLLGYRGLRFATPDGRADWHLDPVHDRRVPLAFWSDVPFLDPAWGDHKVIWEHNRQQHWMAYARALWLTGDGRFADAIVDDLESWMAANPPLMGANWASMLELGFRSLSWLWGLHALLGVPAGGALRGETPWLVDLCLALDRQMTHVAHNLSYYFSPNTHLTGEALALYTVGHALPELAQSTSWIDTGRRVLLDELERQVSPDGGHVERSTHYHRYTCDFYLLAWLVAERNGDQEAARRFGIGATRMAAFLRSMADSHGRLPQVGDDDGGMLWPLTTRDPRNVRATLALAALLSGRADLAWWPLTEDTWWLASAVEPDALAAADAAAGQLPRDTARGDVSARRVEAELFEDSGFVTMRDGTTEHLVFDVGPHGYLNAGHAHADALAITLVAQSRPLLIDPGTSTYTMDRELRDRLRASASHNTLTVDGRSASTPAGPFHWSSRADAQLHGFRRNGGFAWSEALHDGYGDVRHRRGVFHAHAGAWAVVDDLAGRGHHTSDQHWHFDPEWEVTELGDSCLLARGADGETAWLLLDAGDLQLVRGDNATGLGWCSPVYGTLVPTWSARLRRTGGVPVSFLTWVVPGPWEARPHAEPCEAIGDRAGAVASRLLRPGLVEVIMLRPGEPPLRDTRRCTVADYSTNARVFRRASGSDGLTALDLCDFTHAIGAASGLISVSSPVAVPDLHLELRQDVLDIRASEIPVRLHLEGTPLSEVASITLNGFPASALHRAWRTAMTLTQEDWTRAGAVAAAVTPRPVPADLPVQQHARIGGELR